MIKVGEIIALCEYVGCDVYNQLGEKYEITKENCSEIYDMAVECMCANGNRVIMYTFEKMQEACERLCTK